MISLSAYALAMTLGRGQFGGFNWAWLVAAAIGLGLFVWHQTVVASPLVPLAMFRNPTLATGFAMSALVTTVVMATLVVGHFYLHSALALNAVHIGLTMASGPVVAALVGIPAGRMVSRLGVNRMILAGLVAMVAGATLLSLLSAALGVFAYIALLVLLTLGCALFQAASNAAVMTQLSVQQRGVGSGLPGLSRNLGLITGASVMGMVFVLGAGATDMTTASPSAVEAGMHITFGVAAALVVATTGIALTGKALSQHHPQLPPESYGEKGDV